jgi:hypothetical protein
LSQPIPPFAVKVCPVYDRRNETTRGKERLSAVHTRVIGGREHAYEIFLHSPRSLHTRTEHIVHFSCILKGGDRADGRMAELNELIESDKRTAAAARSVAISRKRDQEAANPPKVVRVTDTARIPNRDAR